MQGFPEARGPQAFNQGRLASILLIEPRRQTRRHVAPQRGIPAKPNLQTTPGRWMYLSLYSVGVSMMLIPIDLRYRTTRDYAATLATARSST